MGDSNTSNGEAADNICFSCGLCCNGVIFADVKLLPEEDAAQLLSLGIPLTRTRRFTQPCAAFDGCRCRIYGARPKYCREFDCLLLKDLQQGRVTRSEALQVIRAAQRRVDKVRKLFVDLGDREQKTALADRFRRMSKRFHDSEPEPSVAEKYGRLTVAFHELSVTLQQSFYPGP